MIGTAAWLTLGGLALVWGVACRGARPGRPGLGVVLGAVGRRVPGWVVLAAAWAFAGVHLFARYTVPR